MKLEDITDVDNTEHATLLKLTKNLKRPALLTGVNE